MRQAIKYSLARKYIWRIKEEVWLSPRGGNSAPPGMSIISSPYMRQGYLEEYGEPYMQDGVLYQRYVVRK